jgi:hypothetical protein
MLRRARRTRTKLSESASFWKAIFSGMLRGALAATTVLLLLGLASVSLRGHHQTVSLEQSGTGSGGQEEAIGTPFHFTKWGPLRSEKWQSSRYRVLALWEAASRSLETCMNAVRAFVFFNNVCVCVYVCGVVVCAFMHIIKASDDNRYRCELTIMFLIVSRGNAGGFHLSSCSGQQLQRRRPYF